MSSLRPMLLLVQFDVSKMNESSHAAFLSDLVTACKANQIDGVVLRQSVFDEEAKCAVQVLRKADKTRSLIVMSEGSQVSSAEEVEARLASGVDLVTTCDPFFLKAGPCALF